MSVGSDYRASEQAIDLPSVAAQLAERQLAAQAEDWGGGRE